jgi:hypothetical protein
MRVLFPMTSGELRMPISSRVYDERPLGAVGLLRGFCRLLASLKLAVILIITLAVVLAWGTLLEAAAGREYTYWCVYGRSWFVALWGMLAVNILAAMLIRFPWKKRQIGFLIAHVGLLVLLVGALRTYMGGIEGRLAFLEGETADSILIPDRNQLTVLRWSGETGKQKADAEAPNPQSPIPNPKVTKLAFYGGPVDWPADKTLDFGTTDGLGVKVLKFYRHARRRSGWVAEEGGRQSALEGGPALKLDVAAPDGTSITQTWLPTDQLSPTVDVGGARLQLHRADTDTILEDFRQPTLDAHKGSPAAARGSEGVKSEAPGARGQEAGYTRQEAGGSQRGGLSSDSCPVTPDSWQSGVLSMHYEGKTYRVPVHGNVGKKIPVGESGILVEIVKYLPDAEPGPKVQFTSRGEEPKNPLLDLLLHLPGQQKALRQLAFAKAPFLTLDGVHGRRCPVRFWYYHPAVKPSPGAEFLQTSDGKLYCRVAVDGAYQWRGEVKQGDRIEGAGELKLSILKYIPQAHQEVTFQPADLADSEGEGLEAAALVEITTAAGLAPQQIWLKQGDRLYDSQWLQTAQGPVRVELGYEYLPLGFSLRLKGFERGMNPGRKGDASFCSSVQLIDPAEGIDQQREISMNRPLSHGKFTFYQSSFQELPDGRQASILSVASDPGRTLKYLGCLMICVGTFVMFYVRGGLFRKRSSAAAPSRTAGTSRPASRGNHRRRAILHKQESGARNQESGVVQGARLSPDP